MFLPHDMLITYTKAENSEIGQKIAQNEKIWNKLTIRKVNLETAFSLMEISKGHKSVFFHHFDKLPEDVGNLPVFFDQNDRFFLRGSNFLDYIDTENLQTKADYDLLYSELPEFRHFTLFQFKKMKMLITSRAFQLQISNEADDLEDTQVPFGDMFNHQIENNVDWTYDKVRRGFKMTAVRDISQNEELFDTYGKRSNYAFFLYYGMLLESPKLNQIDKNEIVMYVVLTEEDPHYLLKMESFHDDQVRMEKIYKL